MLTASRLKKWSIDYYQRTADEAQQAGMDRQRANGGLSEYYSEADTRVPTWLVVGDVGAVAELTGLDAAAVAGGPAGGAVVRRWLDAGIAPSGAHGRGFGERSVHGFDLTFCAPKSVSLFRAITNAANEKAVAVAHERAVKAAMDYLAEHAAYTRVHNPETGMKDLQKLPGLVGIAYQHETSRGGPQGCDPHLHTHLIVPNRQARADGTLVSLDSKSLYHELKAAGCIYQAVLRHELHVERGVEWEPVDPRTGMAEIAGIAEQSRRAWSQRSSQLREWGRGNLRVGEDGTLSAAQLETAQKATRPAKPESLAWETLREQWRADPRGLVMDRPAHHAAREARAAAPRQLIDRARLVDALDKAGLTRADIVERVAALVPFDAPDPVDAIQRVVDSVAQRITDPREAHHREGHERYSVDAVLVEEARILDLVDARDSGARLDVRTHDLDALSEDQARVIGAIAESPWLVQPLSAPAGAGKTTSLAVLRAAAHRAAKQVLVLAVTGRAVDEAMSEGAADHGMTIAKALHELDDGRLQLRRTLVVVDEASMVATPDLGKLLDATTRAGAKTVLVGDPYQLVAVAQRGGMFEHLAQDLPWSQQLSEVWRMRDPGEREASLGLRSGEGEELRDAIRWYAEHDRLRSGSVVAMAADAADAYTAARTAGADVAIVCDRWEVADAINDRLARHYTPDLDAPAVTVARDQSVRTGDLIVTRDNDPTIAVQDPDDRQQPAGQVRNGQRWRVAGIDTTGGRIAAERLSDGARAILPADYAKQHVTLGYAMTAHAAQGMTIGGTGRDGINRPGTCLAVISEKASRATAYVALTRGKDTNRAYIYTAAGEAQDDDTIRRGDRRDATAALFNIALHRDNRAETAHRIAEHAHRPTLPPPIAALLDNNDTRRDNRTATWDQHQAENARFQAAYERIRHNHSMERSRNLSRSQDYGLDL